MLQFVEGHWSHILLHKTTAPRDKSKAKMTCFERPKSDSLSPKHKTTNQSETSDGDAKRVLLALKDELECRSGITNRVSI